MIIPYKGVWPTVHETAFVAPSADLIGEVEVGALSSIWFQCVVRGDVHWIRIGSKTNIQDQSMLHVTRIKSPLRVGNQVTVGHTVTLHGCTVSDRVLIGMGSVVLDDAVIGEDCIVGAHSLVTKGTEIPARSLVLGSPAKVIRSLTADEIEGIVKSAANYVGDLKEYQAHVRGPKRLGATEEGV